MRVFAPSLQCVLWAAYLKAMLAPPPCGVFFRRHVNHWHNVTNLQGSRGRKDRRLKMCLIVPLPRVHGRKWLLKMKAIYSEASNLNFKFWAMRFVQTWCLKTYLISCWVCSQRTFALERQIYYSCSSCSFSLSVKFNVTKVTTDEEIPARNSNGISVYRKCVYELLLLSPQRTVHLRPGRCSAWWHGQQQ